MSKWVDDHFSDGDTFAVSRVCLNGYRRIMIEKDQWYITEKDARSLIKEVNAEIEGLRDLVCARDCYIEQGRPKNKKRTLPLIVLREWLNDFISKEISMSRLRQNIDEFFKANLGKKELKGECKDE